MKVTAWTNEEYARKHYRDLFDERLKLANPDKKMLSLPELKKQAEEKNIPLNKFMEDWLKEYDKIPTFTDEEKAKANGKLQEEIEKCIIEHCKNTGIRFSADYHQYGNFGIPIIDDTYMYMGFMRTWGWIMAMANGDESEKGYLTYYLANKDTPEKLPNEIEGENCIS
jgi:hypothetical protein